MASFSISRFWACEMVQIWEIYKEILFSVVAVVISLLITSTWFLGVRLLYKLSNSIIWMVLWRPTRPSRTNTQKRCPFHHRELECKSRKSRDTWSNRQIWPWSPKWSRAKANSFAREHIGHSKNPLPTTQEMTLHMDITTWSILKSDWLYSLQPKWRSSIQSAKTGLGADCGSNHELLIGKFRLELKKVGKTTSPFRDDLNQITYDYTVEMINRSRD